MNSKLKLGIRIGVVVLAVSFIAIGIVRGDVAAVYQKAIQICLSCIGIG